MKNSSIAILAALGLAGAAGVYLAMQDPAEETVEDISTQAADGSGGGDVMTKGELCKKLRTELIPSTKSQIQEAQDELAAFLANDGEAMELARAYRAEIGAGSTSNGRKRQAETHAYIATGATRTLTTSKQLSKRLSDKIENARKRVVGLETTIDSLRTALETHEADELSLITESAC